MRPIDDEVPVPARVKRIEIETCPRGALSRFQVEMVADGLGRDILVPAVVARGARPGPTLAVTAAIHGNELNGIPVIHRVLQGLDVADMAGTLLAVPVVNVPGYLRNQREFNDGADLNRIMPGQEGGTNSQVYASRFLDRFLRGVNYMIDLHTASFGRVNSLYVRADLRHPETRWMAEEQRPQIMVHNRGVGGTLRHAAMELGIPSITVEVGNPQRFQDDLIASSTDGVRRVMARLGMTPAPESPPPAHDPIVCQRSTWLYTDRGGVLEVFPHLVDRVRVGERIAQVRTVFGDVIRDYHAAEAGVVIGRSTNPVNQTGSRILHLGIEGEPPA